MTKDIYVAEVSRLWEALKERDDTIFENIQVGIDPEAKFEELRENNSQLYYELIHENSIYETKKMIRAHFWEDIVGDLYENTVRIMKEAGLLEEALESFEKNYKIENTARLILENGVFSNFSAGKKKELTDELVEMCFYPATFYENNVSLLENDFLEENWVAPKLKWAGDRIVDVARVTKNIYLALLMALVSPATALMAVPSRIGDKITGRPTGMDPTLRKFYNFIEQFNPVNFLFKFLNKDLYDISSFLKRVNNVENEDIQEVLREMNANSFKIIDKCWARNRYQISSSDPSNPTLLEKIKHVISGKGIANAIRDPKYNNEMQLMLAVKNDAADPKYQKMFYDFRTCVYEKIFEIILGYAKAIYSMDDASYEIIKAANEAHQRKNFKAFFDLKPKQQNEEAMFKIMRALVAIDSISYTLDKRKGELVADKYIDKFSEFLKQNIKQVYQELNEMANQRKYNLDRYNAEQPTDEEKEKAIKENRLNAKRSIFDN